MKLEMNVNTLKGGKTGKRSREKWKNIIGKKMKKCKTRKVF